MNQNKEMSAALSMEELLANLESISSGARNVGQILQTYENSNRNFLVSGMKRLSYPEHLSAQHRNEVLRLRQECQKTMANGRTAYNAARDLDELSEKRNKFIPPQHYQMGAAPMATQVIHKSSETPYKSGCEKVDLTISQISLNLTDIEIRIFNLETADKEIKEVQKIQQEQERLQEENELLDELLDEMKNPTPRSSRRRPDIFEETAARSRSNSTKDELSDDDGLSQIVSNRNTPSPI